VRLIFDWFEADRGAGCWRDPEFQNGLTPAARCDRESRTVDLASGSPQTLARITISHTISITCCSTKEGRYEHDAVDDERFESAASIAKARCPQRPSVVPLQDALRRSSGAMYVDTYTPPANGSKERGHPFPDEHLKLITAIGHQSRTRDRRSVLLFGAVARAKRLAAMDKRSPRSRTIIKNIRKAVRGAATCIESGTAKDDNRGNPPGDGGFRRSQPGTISTRTRYADGVSKERENPNAPMGTSMRRFYRCHELDAQRCRGRRANGSSPISDGEPPIASLDPRCDSPCAIESTPRESTPRRIVRADDESIRCRDRMDH